MKSQGLALRWMPPRVCRADECLRSDLQIADSVIDYKVVRYRCDTRTFLASPCCRCLRFNLTRR